WPEEHGHTPSLARHTPLVSGHVPSVSRETHEAARAVGRPTLSSMTYRPDARSAATKSPVRLQAYGRPFHVKLSEKPMAEARVNAPTVRPHHRPRRSLRLATNSSVRRPSAPARLADTSWIEGSSPPGTRYHTLWRLRAFGADRLAA